MRPMGRPRQRHKDLPRGLYKDAAGRFYLKAFTEDDRRGWAGNRRSPWARIPPRAASGPRSSASATTSRRRRHRRRSDRALPRGGAAAHGGGEGPAAAEVRAAHPGRSTSGSSRRSSRRCTAPANSPAARPRRPWAASSAPWTCQRTSAPLRPLASPHRATGTWRRSARSSGTPRNAARPSTTPAAAPAATSRSRATRRCTTSSSSSSTPRPRPVLRCLMDLDVMVGSR
jgi:hypothetical protein